MSAKIMIGILASDMCPAIEEKVTPPVNTIPMMVRAVCSQITLSSPPMI